MEIRTMGRKSPTRMAVMAKVPDSLRMEAIPPIGPPDFMLSSTKGRLRVFLPAKGEFYVGDADRHLTQFVPLSIDMSDVVSILMGTFPPVKAGDCFLPEVAEGDLRRIDVLSAKGELRMSLWVKGLDRDLLRIKKFGADDQLEYTVVYSEYTMIGPIAMPGKIIIRKGGLTSISQEVTIRYSDMEFMGSGDPGAFDLPIPAGITPTPLIDEKMLPQPQP